MKSEQKNNNEEYFTIDFSKLTMPWAILLSVVIFTAGVSSAIYFGLKGQVKTVTEAPQGQDEYQEPEAVKLTSKEFDNISKYLKDLPSKGSDNATVAIVEFGDYSCHYCGVFFDETSSTIKKEYIDKGKVKMFYVDFPRTVDYLEAQKYSVCVKELYGDKAFFAYHDELYANIEQYYTTATFASEKLKPLFAKYGIDMGKVQSCVKKDSTQEKLDSYQSLLSSLGGNSTPTFFVGTISNGKITSGEVVVGAQPVDAFRSILNSYLK